MHTLHYDVAVIYTHGQLQFNRFTAGLGLWSKTHSTWVQLSTFSKCMHTYCTTACHNTHKECFKFMTYIRLYVLAVQVIDIGISYSILLHHTRTTFTDAWFQYPYTLFMWNHYQVSERTMGA